jgi:UDP-N-acetylglucosamine 4,6-dehydratase
MVGGEIYVKKIPSMKVVDIAKVIAPEAKLDFIGIRPGEKLHEVMISVEDARSTFEYEKHYKILPQIHDWSSDPARTVGGIQCQDGFSYGSDNNKEWMTQDALQSWMNAEYGIVHKEKI